jgi:hypothetical protein
MRKIAIKLETQEKSAWRSLPVNGDHAIYTTNLLTDSGLLGIKNNIILELTNLK